MRGRIRPLVWKTMQDPGRGGAELSSSRRNGARLEMTELVDRYYAEVQAMGGNRWDTSSLIARLEKV